MERISLTRFVDFVLKVGTPRVTDVKELKDGTNELYRDFYRPLREAIVAMHHAKRGDAALDELLASLTDERKRRIFPGLVTGYRKFLGSAEMKWFTPPTTTLSLGDLEVNINPELGLEINGARHVIKTYFRGEPLAQKRISIVLSLLNTALRAGSPGVSFGVLDVKNAKLHTLKAIPNPRVNVLLRGEAASFSMMYASV